MHELFFDEMMRPDIGSAIRFTIEQDLGTRVALDEEFHFARIRLSTGEVIPVSFDERQFSKLKDQRAEITAAAVGQVFDQAPASFNTSDNIAFAERMDQKAVSDALEAYSRAMQDYCAGRSSVHPQFPDIAKLEHWKDDFKLHAAGAPQQRDAVLHLDIDAHDLKPSHSPVAQPSRRLFRQIEFAQAIAIFRDINAEVNQAVTAYRDVTGKSAPTPIDMLLLVFASVASTVAAKMRAKADPTRQALALQSHTSRRASI